MYISKSRPKVLAYPRHVELNIGEYGGYADTAPLGAEGHEAGQEHGLVDALARDEGAAAVAVAGVLA